MRNKEGEIRVKLLTLSSLLTKTERQFLLQYARRFAPKYAQILVPILSKRYIPTKALQKYSIKYRTVILEKVLNFLMRHLMIYHRTAGYFQQIAGYEFLRITLSYRDPFFVKDLSGYSTFSAHQWEKWECAIPMIYLEKLLFEFHMPYQIDIARDLKALERATLLCKVSLWTTLISGYINNLRVNKPVCLAPKVNNTMVDILRYKDLQDTLRSSTSLVHIMTGNLWINLFISLSELRLINDVIRFCLQMKNLIETIVTYNKNSPWAKLLVIPFIQCLNKVYWYYYFWYPYNKKEKFITGKIADVINDLVGPNANKTIAFIEASHNLSFIISLMYIAAFEDRDLYKHIRVNINNIRVNNVMKIKLYLSDFVFWLHNRQNNNFNYYLNNVKEGIALMKKLYKQDEFKELRIAYFLWRNILFLEGKLNIDPISEAETVYRWSLRNAKHLLPLTRWCRRMSYKLHRFLSKEEWDKIFDEWTNLMCQNPELVAIEEYVPLSTYLGLKSHSRQRKSFELKGPDLPINKWEKYFNQWCDNVKRYFLKKADET